jgi:hypothetical protein
MSFRNFFRTHTSAVGFAAVLLFLFVAHIGRILNMTPVDFAFTSQPYITGDYGTAYYESRRLQSDSTAGVRESAGEPSTRPGTPGRAWLLKDIAALVRTAGAVDNILSPHASLKLTCFILLCVPPLCLFLISWLMKPSWKLALLNMAMASIWLLQGDPSAGPLIEKGHLSFLAAVYVALGAATFFVVSVTKPEARHNVGFVLAGALTVYLHVAVALWLGLTLLCLAWQYRRPLVANKRLVVYISCVLVSVTAAVLVVVWSYLSLDAEFGTFRYSLAVGRFLGWAYSVGHFFSNSTIYFSRYYLLILGGIGFRFLAPAYRRLFGTALAAGLVLWLIRPVTWSLFAIPERGLMLVFVPLLLPAAACFESFVLTPGSLQRIIGLWVLGVALLRPIAWPNGLPRVELGHPYEAVELETVLRLFPATGRFLIEDVQALAVTVPLAELGSGRDCIGARPLYDWPGAKRHRFRSPYWLFGHRLDHISGKQLFHLVRDAEASYVIAYSLPARAHFDRDKQHFVPVLTVGWEGIRRRPRYREKVRPTRFRVYRVTELRPAGARS